MIKRFISLCLSAALCAVCLSGCKEEFPRTEIPSESAPQSSLVESAPEPPASSTTSSENAPEMPDSSVTFSENAPEIPASSTTSSENAPEPPASSTTSSENAPETPASSVISSGNTSSSQSQPVHNHSYKVTKRVAATCTQPETTTYSCSCGEHYTEQTAKAPGHNYTTKRVEATCTSAGYTEHTCKNCGDSYTDGKTSATGHNYTTKRVEATCTKGGYTEHTCKNCGDKYTDEKTSATGHSWSDWTTTKEATSSSEGEKQCTCTKCGETQTQTIPRSTDTSAYCYDVVEIVNAERAKQGLAPLAVDPVLMEYAQLRSTEIVSNFAHERPDGSSPLNYVMTLDGVRTSGENIAYGQESPQAVMTAWMNSPGHHANIMNSRYTKIGVGCYKANGRLYWTQIFAG